MSFHRALALLGAGAASMLLTSSSVFAEPLAQTPACPVASDDVVSKALGKSAELFDPTFGVTVDGADTECIFSAGGQLVLVRREKEYFSNSPTTVDQAEGLRLLVADELDYVPVAGVGDSALWATVRDRSLAGQRMSVLISKQGADAYAVGVMDTPAALDQATALTQAVVAAQVP